MNHLENTDSLSTLSNPVSKVEIDELFPFTKAIMDDADRFTQQDNASQQYRPPQPSISDEVIKKGESDPIHLQSHG